MLYLHFHGLNILLKQFVYGFLISEIIVITFVLYYYNLITNHKYSAGHMGKFNPTPAKAQKTSDHKSAASNLLGNNLLDDNLLSSNLLSNNLIENNYFSGGNALNQSAGQEASTQIPDPQAAAEAPPIEIPGVGGRIMTVPSDSTVVYFAENWKNEQGKFGYKDIIYLGPVTGEAYSFTSGGKTYDARFNSKGEFRGYFTGTAGEKSEVKYNNMGKPIKQKLTIETAKSLNGKKPSFFTDDATTKKSISTELFLKMRADGISKQGVVLLMGMIVEESGWASSSIAKTKHNLSGMGGTNAITYKSVSDWYLAWISDFKADTKYKGMWKLLTSTDPFDSDDVNHCLNSALYRNSGAAYSYNDDPDASGNEPISVDRKGTSTKMTNYGRRIMVSGQYYMSAGFFDYKDKAGTDEKNVLAQLKSVSFIDTGTKVAKYKYKVNRKSEGLSNGSYAKNNLEMTSA